jgi:hypothetical protein|tara:strand:+ start:69 stop:533 length:465 start_codon:yes stop_codon:yes gene_type:complete
MSYIIGMDITATGTTLDFQLGQIGQAVDGKLYKYVQYDTGAGGIAAVSGNVVGFYAPGGASAGATTMVTADASDTARVGAGVLNSAPADGEYCWIQVTGARQVTTALTAGADGNALTTVGAGDSTLDVSAAVTDAVCATAIDASAKIIMCQFPL